MKNLDLYLKIYKSNLKKDLKLYLYNYIYFSFFTGHFFNFNKINNLIFYIVDNQKIYFEEINYTIKGKFKNCFIKSKDIKVFGYDYNYDLKEYIVREQFRGYLKKKFKKFLDFLEKNKDKFKFLEITEENGGKIYNLTFYFLKELELSDYIEEIKKYLIFLNLYYLFVFKGFDVKKYYFNLNKYENAEFILWSSIFNTENTIIYPGNKVKISLALSKDEKIILYKVYPVNIVLNNLMGVLGKLYEEGKIEIIKQYKNKIEKIINLAKRVWNIKKIIFLQIILKIWCDTNYWNKKLGYKEKIIKTSEFEENFYIVKQIDKISNSIFIYLGDIIFLTFKEKIEEKFSFYLLRKIKVIKKFKINELSGKNNNIKINILLDFKEIGFIEIKQFNDTIYFIDKESKEVVYKININLKIEEVIG